MRSEHVTVRDGLDLHLLRWDGDPGAVPFVLVHGLASNARLWQGVARRLAERGHPVVAVDQRGHGRSSKPDDGYDFPTVTDDLLHLVDRLGLDRPVVAGQSWGGNVVLEMAARFAGSTRGVVCVDGGTIELGTTFAEWDDCARAMAPPKLAGTAAARLEGAMRAAHPDWSDEAIDGAMANFEILDDGTIRPWLTLDRHLRILRALWEHRPSTRYAQIVDPVLFVTADSGASSWTADKRAGIDRALEALPRARSSWFSPADHDVHAQKPDEVAALMASCVEDGFFS